jgi:hypothetical protein
LKIKLYSQRLIQVVATLACCVSLVVMFEAVRIVILGHVTWYIVLAMTVAVSTGGVTVGSLVKSFVSSRRATSDKRSQRSSYKWPLISLMAGPVCFVLAIGIWAGSDYFNGGGFF